VVGSDSVHFAPWSLIGRLYQPRMTEKYGAFVGMWIGRGKRSTRRKPATLSTTNPTWPDLGSDLGYRCGKPATNPRAMARQTSELPIHLHAPSTQHIQLLIIYSKLATCSSLVDHQVMVHLFRWNCSYCLCAKYWPVCKWFLWCT
jgi:hypothetical protein